MAHEPILLNPAGSTVRNIQAFQVLHSVFLKATSEHLTSTILGAINTVFSADNANYFLVEHLNTLPQFAEKIASKHEKTQEKFFLLIEFVVQQLSFVPCKELISISLVLKQRTNLMCCVHALKSLISIVKFEVVFKDVFREVGTFKISFFASTEKLISFF